MQKLHIFLLAMVLNQAYGQVVTPDISTTKCFKSVGRNITIVKNKVKSIVHLDAKPNNGIAWVKSVDFETGTLELDIKGKNVEQQSFVGIAFHGLNDSVYDAVYFRPFNFQSDNELSRTHKVQYISMPRYDWFNLRKDFKGKYENSLTRSVDPNSWFHAKIVVDTAVIKVCVNDDDRPSLTLKPLCKTLRGQIGFWVGNGSAGDFANLSVVH